MTRYLVTLLSFILAFTHAAEPEPAKPPPATELRILNIARDERGIRVEVAIYNRTGKALLVRNFDPEFTSVRLTKPDGARVDVEVSQINLRKPLRKADFLVLKANESKTTTLTLPRITVKNSKDWFNWGEIAHRVGDADFDVRVEIEGVNLRQKLAGEIPSPRIDEAFPANDYFRQEQKLTATREYRAKDVPKNGKALEPFDFGPRR